SRGYELMLEAHSIGLEVLNERTNGIRDIEIAAVVAHSYVNSICYKYDGHTYQIAKRTSVPIGEEAPRDLSNYETREPLAQLPGQDAAQILEQARDWIWQNLQRHKLSYLSVSTNGSDGTEANFTFFINKSETGQWQVVARVHKVVLEQASPSEPPRKIIEDELWSTDKVQRIDPKSEDPLNPRVFSDTEILSPERFRLRFLDFGGFELLIL
ncbi:MAG: hypothetical protein HY046_12400, partial [Acidobacteria bacterium]|nr:hypothetical protein [Acidobacteriota bacterium]